MIVHPNCGLGSAGSSVGAAIGSSIMAAAPLTGPAMPITLAVGALVTLGSVIAGALHIGEGCGPTCVQATQIVNQAEPTFKMNLDGYEQGIIDQQSALNNFNQMWTAIQQSCGGIPGKAGQDCVGDRKEGACKWKDNGECWNWFVGYRDPLLKPATVPYAGSSLSSEIGSIGSNPLLLGGALLLVGVMMSGK